MQGKTPIAIADFDGRVTVETGKLDSWDETNKFIRSLYKQALRSWGRHPNDTRSNASKICVTGAPGSGKSTLARHLENRLGMTVTSTGDIARRFAEDDPFVKAELAAGRLCPPEIMDNFCLQMLKEEKDMIIDGYPRDRNQLKGSWIQAAPIYVFVDTPVSLCVQRLLARARHDDDPVTILNRIKTYMTETEPVLLELITKYDTPSRAAVIVPGWHNAERMASHAEQSIRKIIADRDHAGRSR